MYVYIQKWEYIYIYICKCVYIFDDDDDVYLDKLQARGVKKSILYMWNVDYSQ
jgi:hypothetical protein